MSEVSDTTIKDLENDVHSLVHKIEAWFQKHFGHITPGTPDHAIAVAAKDDLVATLTPATETADPAIEA